MIEDRELFRTVTIVDSFGKEHRQIQRVSMEIRWPHLTNPVPQRGQLTINRKGKRP